MGLFKSCENTPSDHQNRGQKEDPTGRSLRIPKQLLTQLDEYCIGLDYTRSKVVAKSIVYFRKFHSDWKYNDIQKLGFIPKRTELKKDFPHKEQIGVNIADGLNKFLNSNALVWDVTKSNALCVMLQAYLKFRSGQELRVKAIGSLLSTELKSSDILYANSDLSEAVAVLKRLKEEKLKTLVVDSTIFVQRCAHDPQIKAEYSEALSELLGNILFVWTTGSEYLFMTKDLLARLQTPEQIRLNDIRNLGLSLWDTDLDESMKWDSDSKSIQSRLFFYGLRANEAFDKKLTILSFDSEFWRLVKKHRIEAVNPFKSGHCF